MFYSCIIPIGQWDQFALALGRRNGCIASLQSGSTAHYHHHTVWHWPCHEYISSWASWYCPQWAAQSLRRTSRETPCVPLLGPEWAKTAHPGSNSTRPGWGGQGREEEGKKEYTRGRQGWEACSGRLRKVLYNLRFICNLGSTYHVPTKPADGALALFPGSLLKQKGRREPGDEANEA